MFELPEFVTLCRQINDTLKGKTVQRGELGNSPHKFVWYNRTHEEFEKLTSGKTVGEANARGKWLFVPLDPGYILLLGECGGKVLFHPPGSKLPKKYHLHIAFEDGSFLTATTQMWGVMELYEEGREQDRQYVKDMRATPIEAEFTFGHFSTLIDDLATEKKRSAKALLTQDQLIPGLGNAIAQDILFRAGLDPRHPIGELDDDQNRALYDAIVSTVAEVIEKGGRYDEFDLYGNRGGYARIMDKNAVGRPCPRCGGGVEKTQYLGGVCYFCSRCQV
jgi:formamidopyrimidine-DNA glycosylase